MAGDAPVIGFLGIGLMGEPMVLRLLSLGHRVHAWNFVPGRTARIEEAGAVVHGDAASRASLVDGDGVRVSADIVVLLEDREVVVALEKMGAAETGDTGADDGEGRHGEGKGK